LLTLLLAATLATSPWELGDGLPVQAPRTVGMSAERLAAIDRVIIRGMTAGGYPGAAVVVGRKGAAVWEKGFGRLAWGKDSDRVTAERTIYDLASLTKVVATSTAIMILYDEGKVALDAPVWQFIPAFSGGFRDSVTVRHLLEHRSGLPAGRDLWRVARTPDEARRMVTETELVCRPGSCYIYSDLGADLLGMIVESVTDTTLDAFCEERIFKPLGMTDTFFRPADSLKYRVAPTEVTPPRGYALRGEVHDENAYALGGVAGHAGLFSTARDLAVFAQMMLNGGQYNDVRILSDTAVALFTNRAAGTRALGWDTNTGDSDSGSGEYLSAHSYGHTGYTGTSMWIDPDREMFVILLTNRVHAARARRPAKVISDVRADLADAAALAVLDAPNGVLAMPASFRADRAVGWNRPAHVARSRRGKASHRKKRSARSKARTAKTGSKGTKKMQYVSKGRVAKGKASATKSGKAKAAAKKKQTTPQER
jgi:serine-type D-Ala-D-Ala carboxypeptidase